MKLKCNMEPTFRCQTSLYNQHSILCLLWIRFNLMKLLLSNHILLRKWQFCMFLPYYAQKYNRKQKTFNVARESWAEISNNNTVDECLVGVWIQGGFRARGETLNPNLWHQGRLPPKRRCLSCVLSKN